MSAESAYLISVSFIILMKIICFILGYLTIRLGYNLIAAGVKGEFKFSAKFGGLKTDLASVSPGLLFVLLGIFLIGCALYVDKEVKLEKMPRSEPEIQSQISRESPYKVLEAEDDSVNVRESPDNTSSGE